MDFEFLLKEQQKSDRLFLLIVLPTSPFKFFKNIFLFLFCSGFGDFRLFRFATFSGPTLFQVTHPGEIYNILSFLSGRCDLSLQPCALLVPDGGCMHLSVTLEQSLQKGKLPGSSVWLFASLCLQLPLFLFMHLTGKHSYVCLGSFSIPSHFSHVLWMM